MKNVHNDIFYLVLIGFTSFVLLAAFILIFVFAYRRRKTKNKHKAESIETRLQQTFLQSQLEIQEQTLRHLSHEIHENIMQVLSLVKLQLGTIDVNKPAALQQKIHDSYELTDKAIHDLRRMTYAVHTSFITEMGLLRSIEYEAARIGKSAGFTTRLLTDGTPVKPGAQKELILFRIIQEVFNCIIKYSAATEVLIEINFLPDVLKITITDNGKGFDLSVYINENPNFGIQLRNMQYRAQLVGAEFTVTSTPRKGTTVLLSLPFSST